MSIPEDCLYSLYELKREIRWWHSSFGKLRSRLPTIIEFIRGMLSSQGVRSQAAAVILPTLESLQEKVSEPRLEDFIKAHGDARKILQVEPDKDTSGSFYNMLHSFWNIMQPVLSHSKEIRCLVDKCLVFLRETPTKESDTKQLLRDLEDSSKIIETDGVTQQIVSTIEDKLSHYENIIPKVTLRRTETVGLANSMPVEVAVIVEDQEEWSEPIKEVIAETFPNLKIHCLKTYDEANKMLEELKKLEDRMLKQRGISKRILVILDLGLPKDENELKSGKCTRNYGKDLLLKLRSYRFNIRTVLLTSHFNFQDDHRWALNNGIQPEDYIWKGQENYRQHVQSCIERLSLREGGVSKIRIYERHSSWIVSIDDIEVSLEPLYFKVFYVLCTRRLTHSCEKILEFLRDTYTDDEFKNIGPERIPDYIYEIRKKIHEAFTKAGRFVDPHVVIVKKTDGEEVRYGVRRGIKTIIEKKIIKKPGLKEEISLNSVSVLVIENDVDWCNKISEFLGGLGCETVVIHSVEEALEKANAAIKQGEVFPAWVCLDMHIPQTKKQWQENPQSGQIEGGLKALKIIRDRLKENVGVVVLTDYYEKDELRQLAIENGVDINHWVPKDENWKDDLAYAAWRLSTEFQLGIRMPVDDDPYSRLRIQLKESDRRNIVIEGVKISLTGKKESLFWTLAERRGRPVQRDELLEKIYGEEGSQNALTQLVKYTKKAIKIALQRAGKKIDPKEIITETAEGYRLKCLIFITPTSDVPYRSLQTSK